MDSPPLRQIRILEDVSRPAEELTPTSAHFGVINGPALLEFMREAVRGAQGTLLVPECQAVPITLGAAVADRQRGYSGAIAIVAKSAQTDGFVALPWKPGMTVTVWFSHPRGVHGFQARIMMGSRDELRLDLPQRLVRYVRRTEERFDLPPDMPVTAALPLTDGETLPDLRVVNLSMGGMAVAVPEDVEAIVGGVAQVQLFIWGRPGPTLAAAIRCRKPGPGPRERQICLEFLDPPGGARLVLSRILDLVGGGSRRQAG